MTQVQKEIAQAFELLKKIWVCEDSVEKMAMAKGHLGRAYQLAAGQEEKEGAEA